MDLPPSHDASGRGETLYEQLPPNLRFTETHTIPRTPSPKPDIMGKWLDSLYESPSGGEPPPGTWRTCTFRNEEELAPRPIRRPSQLVNDKLSAWAFASTRSSACRRSTGSTSSSSSAGHSHEGEERAPDECLASLAAIQLLSSCYTLPVEYFASHYRRDTSHQELASHRAPDLISSLAMHCNHCSFPTGDCRDVSNPELSQLHRSMTTPWRSAFDGPGGSGSETATEDSKVPPTPASTFDDPEDSPGTTQNTERQPRSWFSSKRRRTRLLHVTETSQSEDQEEDVAGRPAMDIRDSRSDDDGSSVHSKSGRHLENPNDPVDLRHVPHAHPIGGSRFLEAPEIYEVQPPRGSGLHW